MVIGRLLEFLEELRGALALSFAQLVGVGWAQIDAGEAFAQLRFAEQRNRPRTEQFLAAIGLGCQRGSGRAGGLGRFSEALRMGEPSGVRDQGRVDRIGAGCGMHDHRFERVDASCACFFRDRLGDRDDAGIAGRALGDRIERTR